MHKDLHFNDAVGFENIRSADDSVQCC